MLRVPALLERIGDIPIIASQLLREAPFVGTSSGRFREDALESLLELRNVLERTVLLTSAQVHHSGGASINSSAHPSNLCCN